MLAAEELHCDWSKVKCEYGSANRNLREKAANGRGGVYGSMQTVGSQGVRTSLNMMQQAGASARGRLIEAIVGPTDPELSCDECFDLLDVYVEFELADRAADAQMPLMRAHLAGCSACRDDHDSLLALLLADPGEPA